jgi:CDGSH-type Zn-finger protein
MSIVRVGMSEDKKFGDGYDAIFGNKPKKAAAKKPAAKTVAAKPAAKKSTAKKK